MEKNIFVEGFLLRNNFTEPKTNVYVNDKCTVTVLEDCYEICFNDKKYGEVTAFTSSYSIYHLVGILTWNDLIDKNYNK